jgi:hypothetical protein
MDASREPSTHRRIGLSLLVSALGVGLCVVVASHQADILWRAYLLGLVPCWLVSMGAAGLIAIGNLTGGRWAAAARPFYLSAMKTLPFVALLFIPLGFGLEHIYPWARASAGPDSFSPMKAAYLSPPFFLLRGAAYFVVWLLIAWWLGSVSQLDMSPASTPSMRRAGALSLVLLVPTTTFAAFDWVMSLEPYWYSAIFGAILIAGGVVAAHALAIYGLARRAPGVRGWIASSADGYDDERQSAAVFGDLGNLLLAFIMVWTYFSLSQFLIIWSANLPSEIVWYARRLSGGWQFVAVAVVMICFAAPFFILLSRDFKRNIRRLAGVAMLVLAGYGLNMYWTIVPALNPVEAADHVANVGALMVLAGLWSALNSWQLGRLLRPDDATDQSNGWDVS